MNTDKDDIKTITKEINKDKMCIILIHHESCGHCIELKPKWEMVKKHHKNNPIKIIDIEASYLESFDHPIKNNVTGFPTIMSTFNGKMKNNYTGERSIEGLNNFIDNNMKLIVKKKINNISKEKPIDSKKGSLFTNLTNNSNIQSPDKPRKQTRKKKMKPRKKTGKKPVKKTGKKSSKKQEKNKKKM